jgi:hypothetical protein
MTTITNITRHKMSSQNTVKKTPARPGAGGQTGKPPISRPAFPASIEDELATLRTAAAAIQQIRLRAQHELEMARRMRAEAQKYQLETETRARSQAQQLLLHTRLTTQKEIEELIRKANAEIQKVLADIRVIRITAQEELAAQKKFTDAARISSLSFNARKEPGATEETKKQPALKK